MDLSLSPFGERSLTLVAGIFGDDRAAAAGAATLRRQMPSAAIAVVQPHDPELARKLEPEQRGIWRTLVRAHMWLGALGLVAGLGFAALLTATWPAAAASPGFTTTACAVFGLFAGGLAGGLLTLRPDHDRVIMRVRADTDGGRWAVVAHPLDQDQAEQARATLADAGGEVVRSL